MIDAGQPDTKLKRNVNGNLELHYTSNQTVTGCTVKPATTIEFICPKQGGVNIKHIYFFYYQKNKFSIGRTISSEFKRSDRERDMDGM